MFNFGTLAENLNIPQFSKVEIPLLLKAIYRQLQLRDLH